MICDLKATKDFPKISFCDLRSFRCNLVKDYEKASGYLKNQSAGLVMKAFQLEFSFLKAFGLFEELKREEAIKKEKQKAKEEKKKSKLPSEDELYRDYKDIIRQAIDEDVLAVYNSKALDINDKNF